MKHNFTPCLPDTQVIRDLKALKDLAVNPVTSAAIADLIEAIRNDLDADTLAYHDALDAFAAHARVRSEPVEMDAQAKHAESEARHAANPAGFL